MSRKLLKFVLALAVTTNGLVAQEARGQSLCLDGAGEERAGSVRPAERGADLFEAAAQLERDALIRTVLERNPTLEAARQAWQAALQKYPQAISLSDPTLSYSGAPLSVGSDQVGYGQILRLSQRFPFPGSLHLRGEVARAEADAARENFETACLHLAAMASVLYDDYYLVHRALEINDEHIRLLEDFQRIATARYAAGTTAQQDPIQAEVEVAQLLHRRVVLEAGRDVLLARINALLHRRPELSLPPPPAELPIPEIGELDPRQLQEQAIEARPDLRAQEAEIRARQARVKLKDLDFYPDFEAMASFNSLWRDSDNRWTVGAGINVPLWRKRIRAGVAEAEARVEQAESARASLEDEIRSQVQAAYKRLQEAGHVVELYRSRVLPAARDQVTAALSGFKTGGSSFLALIEAERNQRTVRLNYHEALADLYRRRAELDRAVGRLTGEASPAGTVAMTKTASAELQGVSR